MAALTASGRKARQTCNDPLCRGPVGYMTNYTQRNSSRSLVYKDSKTTIRYILTPLVYLGAGGDWQLPILKTSVTGSWKCQATTGAPGLCLGRVS